MSSVSDVTTLSAVKQQRRKVDWGRSSIFGRGVRPTLQEGSFVSLVVDEQLRRTSERARLPVMKSTKKERQCFGDKC